jgi:hypothetical protein
MDRADCARCERRSCLWEGQKHELMCLRNISVDDVFEAVRRMLDRLPPSVRGARGREGES